MTAFEPLWWHWTIFGLALAAFDLYIPSFTLLWFGIGAVATGFAAGLYDAGPPLQVSYWMLSSLSVAAFWALWVRPGFVPEAGPSGEAAPPALRRMRRIATANACAAGVVSLFFAGGAVLVLAAAQGAALLAVGCAYAALAVLFGGHTLKFLSLRRRFPGRTPRGPGQTERA